MPNTKSSTQSAGKIYAYQQKLLIVLITWFLGMTAIAVVINVFWLFGSAARQTAVQMAVMAVILAGNGWGLKLARQSRLKLPTRILLGSGLFISMLAAVTANTSFVLHSVTTLVLVLMLAGLLESPGVSLSWFAAAALSFGAGLAVRAGLPNSGFQINPEVIITFFIFPIILMLGATMLGRYVARVLNQALNEQANVVQSNANLVTQTRQQNNDLALINQLNDACNQGESLDTVFEILANQLNRILPCQNTAIFLTSPDNQYLVARHLLIEDDLLGKLKTLIGRKLPPIQARLKEGGIYQQALEYGAPRILNDPDVLRDMMYEFVDDPWLRTFIPQAFKFFRHRSILQVPLMAQGKPIGLIDASRREPFTEAELRRVRLISTQLTLILERKQVETQLKASEARLRAAVDNLPFEFWMMDAEGRFVLQNPVAEQHWGSAVGKFPSDLGAAANTVSFWQNTNQRALAGEIINYDTTYPIHGQTRHFHCIVSPIRDAGQIVGALVINIDITDRKQAEAALRQSELQYRELFEQAKTALAQTEALHRAALSLTATTDMSQIFDRILLELWHVVPYDSASIQLLEGDHLRIIAGRGFPENKKIVGISFPVHGDNPNAQVLETRRSVIIDDVRPDYPAFNRPPHNSATIVSWLGAPMILADKIAGMIVLDKREPGFYTQTHANTVMAYCAQAVIAINNAQLFEQAQRELAERQQVEAALEQERNLLRTLIDLMPDHIYVKDTESRFIVVNNFMAHQMGLNSPSELLGKTDFDIHPPEDAHQFLVEEQHLFETGESLINKIEAILTGDGQQRWLLTTKIPLSDSADNVTGLVGIGRDITERKRAEEQIEASLHEKEVLLKEVHHRVKNNLQIVSSLFNLQSNLVDDPAVLEILQDSQNRVRSMALVHELLYRSENLASVSLLEYVRELTSHLLRSLRTQQQPAFGVNLKIHGDPILLNVNDLVPAGLIINELVTNALKYAFPNGRTGQIEIVASAGPESGWQLTVSDDGIGFPSDVDFHNTTSLGLQLVNVLVSQLDGQVSVVGSGGTRVIMNFPTQALPPV